MHQNIKAARDAWQSDLECFAQAIQLRRTPTLHIRTRQFEHLWCPPSWDRSCWGCGGLNRVVIAREALESPNEEVIRPYLLLHELGHIKCRHSVIVITWTSIFCGATVLSYCCLPQVLCFLLLLFAAPLFIWLPLREHQADDISCAIIGNIATLNGMRALRVATGTYTQGIYRMRRIEKRISSGGEITGRFDRTLIRMPWRPRRPAHPAAGVRQPACRRSDPAVERPRYNEETTERR